VTHPRLTDLRLAMFDWDGTLFDSFTLSYNSAVEIFRRFSLPPPPEETYRDEISANFIEFYRKYGIPPEITHDKLNEIRKRFFLQHWQGAVLNDAAEKVLLECKNLRILTAIVSAEVPAILNSRLTELKLLPLIDRVRGGAWPKENALRETLEFFKVEAGNSFYADDTFDGMLAAKKVGIVTVGCTWGYNSKQHIMSANPDFIIDSLEELIEIIKNGEE